MKVLVKQVTIEGAHCDQWCNILLIETGKKIQVELCGAIPPGKRITIKPSDIVGVELEGCWEVKGKHDEVQLKFKIESVIVQG